MMIDHDDNDYHFDDDDDVAVYDEDGDDYYHYDDHNTKLIITIKLISHLYKALVSVETLLTCGYGLKIKRMSPVKIPLWL